MDARCDGGLTLAILFVHEIKQQIRKVFDFDAPHIIENDLTNQRVMFNGGESVVHSVHPTLSALAGKEAIAVEGFENLGFGKWAQQQARWFHNIARIFVMSSSREMAVEGSRR